MANRALLVGINAYRGRNRLDGCINDIKDVTDYLVAHRGFRRDEIETIIDADATTANILSALEALVASLKAGDRALFHYSGHGAQMPTRSNGEVDGLDEVICPVDFDGSDRHAIRDDDFNRIFSKVPQGVEFVWVSDSCHSGTLERKMGQKPRAFRLSGRIAKEVAKAREDGVHARKLTAPSRLNIALISGCTSEQSSADAEIDGRYNGAATYFLLRELRAQPNLPLTDIVLAVDQNLQRNRYEQEPQLAGSAAIRGRAFLQELGAVPA